MSSYINRRAKERDLPMIDANKPIVIEVTKADCKKGDLKNPMRCALARAVEREYKDKGVVAAYLFRSCAWLEYDDKLVRYHLPSSTKKEIVSFDRGGGFAPGHYQLSRVPHSSTKAELRRKAERDKRKNHHPAKPGKAVRSFVHKTENVRSAVIVDESE